MSETDQHDENPTGTAVAKDEPDTGSAEVQKWKALARKHEDEVKQLRPLAQKAQEAEDAKKGEVERLGEQIAALTKERDSAVSKADRLEVSILKSLKEDDARRITSAAKRLTGTTREELEADADEFLTAFGGTVAEPKPTPTGKPREQLKPGNNEPDAPPDETDVRKLGERMFSA